jgi:hypothetical protein
MVPNDLVGSGASPSGAIDRAANPGAGGFTAIKYKSLATARLWKLLNRMSIPA